MNLFELDQIINQLIEENNPSNDELISFYYRKRDELVVILSEKINEIIENA